MFDGSSFRAVATALDAQIISAAVPEAFGRSAIGRAYYACFHAARGSLFQAADWSDKKKTTHKAVRQATRKAKGNFVADKLDTLVVLREHADYHTWNPSQPGQSQNPPPSCTCKWDPHISKNVGYALGLADDVLSAFGVTVSTP